MLMSQLRNDGGFEYKREIVDTLIAIVEENPDARLAGTTISLVWAFFGFLFFTTINYSFQVSPNCVNSSRIVNIPLSQLRYEEKILLKINIQCLIMIKSE